MIAVVCAVPAERRALAELAGPDLALHVWSGAAAERTAAAWTAQPLRALVSAGFCGALRRTCGVGDLVAPDEVRDEASGESFAPDPEMLAAAPGARHAGERGAAGPDPSPTGPASTGSRSTWRARPRARLPGGRHPVPRAPGGDRRDAPPPRTSTA